MTELEWGTALADLAQRGHKEGVATEWMIERMAELAGMLAATGKTYDDQQQIAAIGRGAFEAGFRMSVEVIAKKRAG